MTMKSINWKLSKKIAGLDTAIAKDILDMLIKTLPVEKQAITKAYADNDCKQLRNQIHKLYGACCYTSLPRLRNLLKTTLIFLHADAIDDALTQIPKIGKEIDQIVEQWTSMNNRAANIFGKVN